MPGLGFGLGFVAEGFASVWLLWAGWRVGFGALGFGRLPLGGALGFGVPGGSLATVNQVLVCFWARRAARCLLVRRGVIPVAAGGVGRPVVSLAWVSDPCWPGSDGVGIGLATR